MPLEITEYNRPPANNSGSILQALDGDAIVSHEIAISGASVASQAFSADTGMVVIIPDADCRVEFSPNPTAVNAGPNKSRKLFANTTNVFVVPVGQLYKVATISAA